MKFNNIQAKVSVNPYNCINKCLIIFYYYGIKSYFLQKDNRSTMFEKRNYFLDIMNGRYYITKYLQKKGIWLLLPFWYMFPINKVPKLIQCKFYMLIILKSYESDKYQITVIVKPLSNLL